MQLDSQRVDDSALAGLEQVDHRFISSSESALRAASAEEKFIRPQPLDHELSNAPTIRGKKLTVIHAEFAHSQAPPPSESIPHNSGIRTCQGCSSAASTFLRFVARVTTLLNSRSQSTELAAAAQSNQSRKLRLAVENACCRKGM
jgi:hypothetical protein